MLTGYVTITPAYGRDYRKASDAVADFKEGKDFVLQPQGCYCSIYDFSLSATANIRYQKLTKVIPVKVGE